MGLFEHFFTLFYSFNDKTSMFIASYNLQVITWYIIINVDDVSSYNL